jgi:hypothetical protein
MPVSPGERRLTKAQTSICMLPAFPLLDYLSSRDLLQKSLDISRVRAQRTVATYSDLGGNSSGNSLDLLSLLVSNESRHSLDTLLLSDLLHD